MKSATSLFLVSVLVGAQAFSPSVPRTSKNAPFFVDVMEKEAKNTAVLEKQPVMKPAAAKKAAPKKAAGGHGKGGIFAAVVVASKKVLGDERLNKIRGKAISLHSEVIGSFVETADTDFGDRVLRSLFDFADVDKNGTIEEEELTRALRSLGFELKEKQMKGIFDRADLDSNGQLDYEEWRKSAPSTLRTNLIKLAKRNGGELGFLA
jgi:hypothetical protein